MATSAALGAVSQLTDAKKSFLTYLQSLEQDQQTAFNYDLGGRPKKSRALASKIFDEILRFQRHPEVEGIDEILERTKESIVHMRRCDVEKALGLWNEHRLGDLDVFDDSLWGWPIADMTKDPLISSDTSRGRSDLAPTLRVFSSGASPAPEQSHPREPEGLSVRKWHPKFPTTLHVGISENDGKDVWAELLPRDREKGSFRLQGYDHAMTRTSEALLNTAWNDEFSYSKFRVTKLAGRPRSREQRAYISNIIRERYKELGLELPASTTNTKKRKAEEIVISSDDEDDSQEYAPPRNFRSRRASNLNISPTPPGIPEALKIEPNQSSSREPERRGTIPCNSPSPFIGLSPIDIEKTSLLVSTSKTPERAPINISLSTCTTLEDFFSTLAITCKLRGPASSQLTEANIKYTWSDTRRLIRKDSPRDWEFFTKATCKGWEGHRKMFEEDIEGCKIEVEAHIKP